jgi:ribosomal protein L40E
MEKKGGFKECSRCGLRNKPTARQCDFCGQRFEEEDKWDQQIDALESLTKVDSGSEVPDDVSKRIESTIVKKDAVERKDRAEPAAVAAVAAAAVAKQAQPDTAPVQTPPEPKVEATPEPMASVKPDEEPELVATAVVAAKPEETVPASEFVEVMEVEDLEPLDEDVQLPVEESVVLKTDQPFTTKRPRFFTWNFNLRSRKDVAFLLVLQGGIVIYLATLLVAADSLEAVGEWGLALVAAAMMTAGLGKLTINWDIEAMGDEDVVVKEVVVEVCPRCHERVGVQDSKCPACGTEFEPSEIRGTA